MKTIKLTAIGAMLMLAFSCAKNNLTPATGIRNDDQPTNPNVEKTVKPGVRNDEQIPIYTNPAKMINPGGVRNDYQLPVLPNPAKISKPDNRNDEPPRNDNPS